MNLKYMIFLELEKQREIIGALLDKPSEQNPASNNDNNEPKLSPEEILIINPDDINILGEDSILIYNGKHIVLYFPYHIGVGHETLEYRPDVNKVKRFHITNCEKLQEIRKQNRTDRYAISTRADGLFTCIYGKNCIEIGEFSLHVCKNCLDKLNWQDYADKQWYEQETVFHGFLINDFFAEYLTFFSNLPGGSEDNLKLENYPRNWHEISNNLRKVKNWRCEICKANLKDYPQYLHCHHKNRNPSDNTLENLEVLCVTCHSDLYPHMKTYITQEAIKTIETARSEQGI